VYLSNSLDEVGGIQLDVLVSRDRLVVIRSDFDFAIGVGGAVFFGLEFGVFFSTVPWRSLPTRIFWSCSMFSSQSRWAKR
jgi:hypothetical protein